MNRIDRIFSDLRQRGAKALMPFITAGDPDLATTAALLEVFEQAGCSVCELGIPFSDPIADGPIIQASMSWALDHGLRTGAILEMVAQVRPKLSMGLVAMVSYSLVYRQGGGDFLARAKAAGIDGLIIPDLPVEEAQQVRARAGAEGLICSFLIAPTTPLERAKALAQASSGFVYVLARAGITGESREVAGDLPARVAALRGVTDLPIAVGFGIAGAEQVRQVVATADAAIVGSAIVRRIAEHRAQGRQAVVEQVRPFVRELVSGLKVSPQTSP